MNVCYRSVLLLYVLLGLTASEDQSWLSPGFFSVWYTSSSQRFVCFLHIIFFLTFVLLFLKEEIFYFMLYFSFPLAFHGVFFFPFVFIFKCRQFIFHVSLCSFFWNLFYFWGFCYFNFNICILYNLWFPKVSLHVLFPSEIVLYLLTCSSILSTYLCIPHTLLYIFGIQISRTNIFPFLKFSC